LIVLPSLVRGILGPTPAASLVSNEDSATVFFYLGDQAFHDGAGFALLRRYLDPDGGAPRSRGSSRRFLKFNERATRIYEDPKEANCRIARLGMIVLQVLALLRPRPENMSAWPNLTKTECPHWRKWGPYVSEVRAALPL
jgi:hypothetical protein